MKAPDYQFAQRMVLCCGKYSEIDYIPELLLTMPGTKKGGWEKKNDGWYTGKYNNSGEPRDSN